LRHIPLLLLCVVAATACAQPKAKKPDFSKPWRWTIEDRLADRFDPAAIRDRQDAYVLRLTPAQRRYMAPEPGESRSSEGARYIIDGSRNPELFLPSELIDGLLISGFDADQTRRGLSRGLYRNGILALGLSEEEFWSLLSSTAERSRSTARKSSTDEDVIQCRTLAATLDALRQRFGHERFDQFLYTTMAPHAVSSNVTNSVTATKEELRQKELGCPN
jgi:hypothetical protein